MQLLTGSLCKEEHEADPAEDGEDGLVGRRCLHVRDNADQRGGLFVPCLIIPNPSCPLFLHVQVSDHRHQEDLRDTQGLEEENSIKLT